MMNNMSNQDDDARSFVSGQSRSEFMDRMSEYNYTELGKSNPVSFNLIQIPIMADGRIPKDCWFAVLLFQVDFQIDDPSFDYHEHRLSIQVKDINASWNAKGEPSCSLLVLPFQKTTEQGIYRISWKEATEDQILHPLHQKEITIGFGIVSADSVTPAPISFNWSYHIGLKVYVPKNIVTQPIVMQPAY
jgi:hypothetical protein